MSQVGKWYARLRLACPFLSEGLCTLYEQRPIACREHIVTSSPRTCEIEETNDPEGVRMPVSVLDALGQFAADLEQSDIEAVMLPLALPWAQSSLERSHRSWPAATMVKRFVDILKLTASKNSAALVQST
jgi:Fe-S-cluster containining protein